MPPNPNGSSCKNHVSMYVCMCPSTCLLHVIYRYAYNEEMLHFVELSDIKLISFLIAKLIYYLIKIIILTCYLVFVSQKQKYLANFSSSTFKITSFNDQ